MLGVDGTGSSTRARSWVLHGGIAGSWLQGSQEAITRLQRAEQRYYQRPDAPHVALDPDRDEPLGLDRTGQPEQAERQRHGRTSACGA